jgi:hypothetical protein
MQIPALDAFRKQSGPAYGLPWSVDPAGVDFTLTIPDGDPEDEDGEWRPHEPSYRLALLVLSELEPLKQKAVDYLAGIVDAGKAGMTGESYVHQVICDARAETVTIEIVWDVNVYAVWSVTFFWREREEGIPRWCWPNGMALRAQ